MEHIQVYSITFAFVSALSWKVCVICTSLPGNFTKRVLQYGGHAFHTSDADHENNCHMYLNLGLTDYRSTPSVSLFFLMTFNFKVWLSMSLLS